MSSRSPKDQVREHAEASLEAFIRLIHPNRVLGGVHKEIIQWWGRGDRKTHQLLLLPRDHQKSALTAYRVAHAITCNPSIRVLYISATANLAIKQLKFIKDILTSDTYRFYWPEMINVEEGKREKWTESEISVDHPRRKADSVRDPTVFVAGLTTTITGLHCDIAVGDDIVIEENAYNEEGREKTKQQMSYLASITGADSEIWLCGTRYNPKDYYQTCLESVVDIYDEEDNLVDSEPLYEIFERQVEVNDQFVWPRSLDISSGKYYGFNKQVLAKKRAQYHDLTKFRAQYYNNPNDASTANIKPSNFQYYDKGNLSHGNDGKWSFKGNRLNIYAAVDFAYTTKVASDYTCIVVIGMDSKHNIYVLDIERFKTSKISDYFDKILKLHVKWEFRKIRAEITAAQSVIVEDLKTNYIRVHGLALSVDEHRPVKNKEDRIEALLQPRYNNLQMWHTRGGNCELLETELVQQSPAHDDIKDALASAVEVAVPPTFMGLGHFTSASGAPKRYANVHPRFGGIG